jgi:NAD-dependent dihydropyrimidine dehydrogenase PreA subunit
MNRIDVDQNLCKGCGVCVNACPRHCLVIGKVINEIGYPAMEFMKEATCSACGLCFYVCPEPGVIRVFKGEDGESDHE